MFGRLWSFVKRHRRKFVLLGVVFGGAWMLGRYAHRKLKDYQSLEAAECFAYVRRQNHFDSNQRTCNATVLSMLPTLRDALCHKLNSDALTAQLRSKPANKLEIWEELKIVSFTRTIVAVYSCCMLVVVLRVQLNILGGYIYRDTLINRNGSQETVVATESVQKQYLSGLHYLLEQGLDDLVHDVEAAVKSCLGQYSLKDQLSLAKIDDIIRLTRSKIEYQRVRRDSASETLSSGDTKSSMLTSSSLCRYMLPREDETGQACYLTREERILGQLNSETRDMIESPDFHTVVTMCLDTGFIHLVNRVAEYFNVSSVDDASIPSSTMALMPLAKIIPIMNGLIHSVVADAPDPFLQELMGKDQMKHFAANVYDAFCESQHERCTIK